MRYSDPKTVSDKIRQSNKILLVTHSRPSVDAIISLAVIYSLLKSYYKKQVAVASTFDLYERYKRIFSKVGLNADQMVNDIPQKSYVIKIKKQGDKIESINFNEENDTFNFVITPFNGKLDLSSVVVDENGAGYDLVISIDTPSLNFIGNFYKSNEQFFANSEIVSFDSHKSNSGFAKENVGADEIDTTSQVIARYFDALQIPLDETYASLLFAGIQSFLYLNLRKNVRPDTYRDLAKLVENKANPQVADDLLYSVYNLNEIFLVGDILDSSNEGTMDGKKVVMCKISLNKEELEKVDMDKTAQVVLWNIRSAEYSMAYVIFQRSTTQSIAYVYTYESDISIAEHVKALGGKGDKNLAKISFASDMNTAEQQLQKEFGIEVLKQENKFGANTSLPPLDDFDFGDDVFAPPTVQNAPYNPPSYAAPFPPAPLVTPPSVSPNNGDENDSQKPKLFDPRAGN